MAFEDIEKYKSNSIFILPFVVKNRNLSTDKSLIKCDLQKIGFYWFLTVDYCVNNIKQINGLKRQIDDECCLYNTHIDCCDSKIILRAVYTLPKSMEMFADIVSKMGYESLTKTHVAENAIYWKEHISDILQYYYKQQTLAA